MLYHNVAAAFLALMVTSALAAPTMRVSADDLAAREIEVRAPSVGQFPDEEAVEPAKLSRRTGTPKKTKCPEGATTPPKDLTTKEGKTDPKEVKKDPKTGGTVPPPVVPPKKGGTGTVTPPPPTEKKKPTG